MKLFTIICLILLLTSCRKFADCPIACSMIGPSETAPEISQKELDLGGCYYGSLDQKRPGTPEDWIHILEGTRSASWCAPTEGTISKCDCNKI